MYDNQEEVDKIEKVIQRISPESRISSYSIDENAIISVGVTIPVKGNSKVIKKLEELGWEKLYRKKVRTDNSRYSRCQYEGYVMYQTMRLDL